MAGKRKLEHFAKYSEAKKAAETKTEEIHNGSVASALTANQSRDALAAFERLETLRHTISRRISFLAAVSEFADARGDADHFGSSATSSSCGRAMTCAAISLPSEPMALLPASIAAVTAATSPRTMTVT